MKNYVSPVILDNEELAEGVYATGSGATGSCYVITEKTVNQENTTGRYDWRCIIAADHVKEADHITHGQVLVVTFNQSVEYVSSNGSLEGSNTGTTLKVRYNYTNNPNDHIRFADLIVRASLGANLAIDYARFDCDKV